jgi:NAD-dependent deacetylase
MRESEIERARRLLAEAAEVVVLTGAGISADSGVPTFRGPDGLWKRHRPEELATPGAFARDPRLVWEWYGWRREVVAACRPNAAHMALARWALRRAGVHIVTQNVDGLHGLAADEAATDSGAATSGSPALRSSRGAEPIELHGSLFRVRCTRCRERYAHREPIDATSAQTLPACRACGALLRPDVVWFGEPLDESVLSRAFELAAGAGACLVVGTSAVVQPAASLATVTAQSGGGVIEVNPDATPLTSATAVSIRASAAEAVPLLVGEPA